MEIFAILQRRSKFFYVFLFVLVLTNAVWNNALLFLLNSKLNGTPLPVFNDQALLGFIALIIISYLVSRTFQSFMMKLTIELSHEMNLIIFNKVRFANYRNFIAYGKEKVYSLLRDAETVSEFPHNFIEAFNSLIVFVVGLSFLFSISVWGATLIFIILIVLGVIYYRKTLETQKFVDQTRNLSDAYHKNIHDLLNGYKEIKISSVKSNNLFERLNANRIRVKELNIITAIKWMNNDLLGRYFWFIVIGVILFVLPSFMKLDTKMVTSFIVTLLFLMGPVASLIGVIPYYSRIKTAMKMLKEFDLEIDLSELKARKETYEDRLGGLFETLEMKNICYEYCPENQQNNFSVELNEFTVTRGELVFITGGNGSGKTTFINILTGLFKPNSGKIIYNGNVIGNDNYPSYRNRMAVIFSDNYLLSENYEDFQIIEENIVLSEYINLMKLENIVQINSTENKLEIELSKGQQKRLCMIYALLENKDILVLDEWAADQDPVFRAYFYNSFLQRLKEMGKTIIMVTHDDMYYRHADRIVKFDFGRILSDTSVRAELKV